MLVSWYGNFPCERPHHLKHKHFFRRIFRIFFRVEKKVGTQDFPSWGTQPETRLRIRGRGVPKLGKPQVPGGWRGRFGWEVQGGVFPETNEWLHLKMAEVGFFYIFLFGANLSNFRGELSVRFRVGRVVICGWMKFGDSQKTSTKLYFWRS